MASVTLNGVTYTDDAHPTTGMANGGHRVRFVPALSDFLAEAEHQINLAAAQVDLAADQVLVAQDQVALAAGQVTLAQDQVSLASGHASAAATSASAAASATSSAGYKGAWSALTGPLSPPASVAHNGRFWALTAPLADVTQAEPGVSDLWFSAGLSRPGALVVEIITSGTSWTAPTGVTYVRVKLQGAGGGGVGTNIAAGYGSGDGGAYAEFVQSVTPGTSYACSVGAGGYAGAGNLPGGAGGSTSMFGVTAGGGAGGETAGSRGLPGDVTGAPAGSMVIGGGAGLDSRASSGDFHVGGNSALGIGGITQAINESSQRRLPTGYGAGGARQHSTIAGTAQAGASGCIILEYMTT